MHKIIFIPLILFLVGCGTDKMNFNIQKKNSDTVQLYIDNFPNFSILFGNYTEIESEIYTSFSDIDSEIYDFLKSNTNSESTCEVYISSKYIDNYGKEKTLDYEQLNNLDLVELRKYENSSFWTNGTKGILCVKYGDCN